MIRGSPGQHNRLRLLHIFLVVYSITTLLVAAGTGERNRAADLNARRPFRDLLLKRFEQDGPKPEIRQRPGP